MQLTVVMFFALTVVVTFVEPVSAYDQKFRIKASSNVSANGYVSFTKDGTIIGGPYWVFCDGESRDYSWELPEKPNDISWSISVYWVHGDIPEPWWRENQPWPATYKITHSSPELEVVLEEPTTVGGIASPVDKLGLLVPYIGLASTILDSTVATSIYAKHVKRRKEK